MKKSDLKTGMRVRLRNGDVYLVLRECDTIYYGHQEILFVPFGNREEGILVGSKFSSSLEYPNNEYTIVKVYSPEIKGAYVGGNVLDKDDMFQIWKREEAKKMTVAEIEKLLGYEIEVVANKVED